jgi:hypothetical protein
MATQAAFQEQYDQLHHLVQKWDRRTRVQQTLLWLPRSLLPGLIAGIALFVAARFVPLRPPAELAALTAAMAFTGLLVMLAWVWLRPRSALVNARRFDLEFRLGERISTALELIEGRIESTDELTSFQIDDASSRGHGINAGELLPLKWDARAWSAVLVALIVLVILFVLPNPQTPATSQRSNTDVAIDNAEAEVERITEELAADTDLSDEDRQALLEQLEQTREILGEEEVSPEEAFASLSDSQAELQERSERFNEQVQQQQSALRQAVQTIQDAGDPAGQEGQQQEQAEAIPTLEQLRESMEAMSEAQRQQMADALEQAADQLEQANPEAAQALREAAEALRNGDIEAAQQALQDAMEAMQVQQQEQQQMQQSAQQMQQQSQQLQQAASQIAQQSQQGQQQIQQFSQQNGQQQEDSGIQPLQQPGQQPGQQSGAQQPGDQAGNQGGDSGQPQMSQPGNQPGDQQGTMQNEQPGVGTGAGDQQGDAGQENATGPQAGEAQTNNNPDGEGVGEFDPVYAPQRVGGEGENEIVLEPDTSDVPVQEGEFSQNPSGQSLVPYNEVFSDYSDAANRALDQDYIPLGLRDVVRDYFSSLEPGQ